MRFPGKITTGIGMKVVTMRIVLVRRVRMRKKRTVWLLMRRKLHR